MQQLPDSLNRLGGSSELEDALRSLVGMQRILAFKGLTVFSARALLTRTKRRGERD